MEKTEAEGLLCPNCRVDLVMAERHGVEIDYCPKCRGIWLDRGEIDKIVERAIAGNQAASPSPPQPAPTSFLPQDPRSPWGQPPQTGPYNRGDYDHDDRRSRDYDDHDDHHGRRRGWLDRLLD